MAKHLNMKSTLILMEQPPYSDILQQTLNRSIHNAPMRLNTNDKRREVWLLNLQARKSSNPKQTLAKSQQMLHPITQNFRVYSTDIKQATRNILMIGGI